MSRRPASCFRLLLLAGIVAGCCACGNDSHEAAAPPPIAASKSDAPKPVEPQPAERAPAPAPTPAQSKAVVADASSKPSSPSAAPAATPGSRPDTSLPGAIPPSPLPDPNAKPKDAPVDPLQWLQDSQARKAEYERALTDAQSSVETATTTIAQWQRTILAFKNPYLPRPQLAPEDAQTIAGMNGIERVKWAEGKLADATAVREAAQKKVDDLKANPPLN